MKRTPGSLEAEVARSKDQKEEEAEVGEAAEETLREEVGLDTRSGESQRRSLRLKRKLRSRRL